MFNPVTPSTPKSTGRSLGSNRSFDGGGGSFSGGGGGGGGGSSIDPLQKTIVEQYLGELADNGTHTTGHAGYTISHAADRAAAQGRFGGYQANSKKATQAAIAAVMGRNKGIAASYEGAAKAGTAEAGRRDKQLQQDIIGRTNAYAKAAAAMGLSTAPDVGNGRAAQAADAERSRLDQTAASWAGFDRLEGKHAVERNTYQGDAFRYAGNQQQQTLNGLLEKVLSGLQDQQVASTLGTAANVSQAQKAAALKGLQYGENAINANDLARQKLLNGLLPKSPTTTNTTNYGNDGKVTGSSTSVRR